MPLLLVSLGIAAASQAQDRLPGFRLVRSVSGPSGNVVAGKLVIDEPRNRFVYPQDSSFVVYFEWNGPAGDHVLTAIWKGPDGRVVSISPDIRLRATASDFGAYWTYSLVPTMPSGYWTVEVRIDGQPAGSHSFEVHVPQELSAAARARPSPDDIYQSTRRSLVWIHRLDASGHRIDTASGFVLAAGQVATAFQAIDSSAKVEIEFDDRRRVPADTVLGYHRLQDWAILQVETGDATPLARGEPAKPGVGERLLAFNVETAGSRTFGGVDLAGRQDVPAFGERLLLSSSLSAEAAGGPLLSADGEVLGILGGSTLPGSRFGPRALNISPSLFLPLRWVTSATPISLLAPSAAPVTIAGMAAAGALSPIVQPTPALVYGGTSNTLHDLPPQSIPPSVREFSRRDQQVWVYSLWRRDGKFSKGSLSVRVYDPQNRVRVTSETRKISIPSGLPLRYAVGFASRDLLPGAYRVDLLLDDQAVWRTYITLTE